jgi:hypothetical protein
MAIRKLSNATLTGTGNSNKAWDQDTPQGAMVPIANVNFNNNVTFNFGNIPQDYRDLVIVINGYFNNPGVLVIDDINMSSPVCSYTSLIGNGSTVVSERLGANTGALPVSTSASPLIAGINTFIINVQNYTSSNFKNVLSRKVSETSGSGTTSLQIGLIKTTSPITYFKFSTQNGANFFTNGRATLYGIKGGA